MGHRKSCQFNNRCRITFSLKLLSILYTYVNKQNIEIEEKNFEEVEQYLNQKVIGNFEVVTLAEILEIYQQNNRKSISSARIQEYINESLADVDSWTPKFGKKLFFNSKVEKRQIIEHFMREMDHLKRNY